MQKIIDNSSERNAMDYERPEVWIFSAKHDNIKR